MASWQWWLVMGDGMSTVMQIFSEIEPGHAALQQLPPLVYDKLCKLAADNLAHEKPVQTLQTAALLHEAYLGLVQTEPNQHWENSRHFSSAAAEAMRPSLSSRPDRSRTVENSGLRPRARNPLRSTAHEW
ncbi:MAG: ECF-type sigma factor [Planctomycetota bacterium]